MVKPIIDLDEVEFDDVEENGFYTSSRGQISDRIGAKKLGYNLRSCRREKRSAPSMPSRRGRDVPHSRG